MTLSDLDKLDLARRALGQAADLTAQIDISKAPWWKRLPIMVLRFGREKLHLYELGAVTGLVQGRGGPKDGKLH